MSEQSSPRFAVVPDTAQSAAQLDADADLVMLMVCDAVCAGKNLLEVAKPLGIRKRTLLKWIDANPARAAELKYAEQEWADALAKEAIEIADTVKLGQRVKTDADGGQEVVEEDMLGHRKLQIDTRLRLAAKLHRDKYGESLAVTTVNIDLAGIVGGMNERLNAALKTIPGECRDVTGE